MPASTTPTSPRRRTHDARLPLLRPTHGRMLGGVCRAVSLHVGVSVWLIRLLFIATTFLFGAGAVAYVFLWMFVPAGDPTKARMEGMSSVPVEESPLSYGNSRYDGGDSRRQDDESAGIVNSGESLLTAIRHASKPSLIACVGLIMIMVGVMTSVGGFQTATVVAFMVCGAGIVVAWLRFNEVHGQLWSMLVGVGLLFLGYAVYILSDSGLLTSPWHAVVAGFALLIGVGLAVVPWANAMVRDLGTERVLKEREEQRADMTAHLHDGVLQTLALIQLHSTEPQTVVSLAHRQERELRDWLYQERTPPDRSVSTGLKDIAAQVEAEHGKPIEVVTVGDAQPSTCTDALLDASRQALVNAAIHGDEPISVYCEAGAHMIEVFVRDHGRGFDVEHIPEGRLGIRESIIGRMRRRGGTVEIVSRPDWGTEVRMHMPLGGVEGPKRASRET